MRTARSDKLIRCAVYTRKSHEEGLEQEFNSLDAQRESAEAYIKSQLHEGWQLINNKYDDGGFSGGNMKRPALGQLLDDIRYKKIDIVVVYKVDRLSRSLSDFSRLIELFDEHGVSFVSVTQQFNTSNSMGRLTLNMLLSFAQFEREVTGERIRDKIEASKKKGLWMGGNPPMGYTVEDRRLIVLPGEAAFVKRCFESYLSRPSILTLAQTFNDEGYRTKCWVSQKGKPHGGKRLSPKYLYRILTNSIYIGRITHKGNQYDGQHQPIIEQVLWDKVQAKIEQKPTKSVVQTESPYMLKGKFRHHGGYSMSPSTFKKKHKDGSIKRTRYYVSQKAIKQGYASCDVKSINAQQIENIVESVLVSLLTEGRDDLRSILECKVECERASLFAGLLKEVVISSSKISLEIFRGRLNEARIALARAHIGASDLTSDEASNLPNLIYQPKVIESDDSVVASINVEIKRIDGARAILNTNGSEIYEEVSTKSNLKILAAFRDAYRWRGMLECGNYKNAKELASAENINYMMMLRNLPLTTLAPEIQKAAITGNLPKRVSLKLLTGVAHSICWTSQSQALPLSITR